MPTILIVDDEKTLLEEIASYLNLASFTALMASDAIQGLQLAHDSRPDLIICDVDMPQMNGYELLEALRSDLTTANIPFIFLSALSTPNNIRIGMNLGADDYLTKPFEFATLMNVIYVRLARHADMQTSRMREFAHRLVTLQENERRNFAYILKSSLDEKLSNLHVILDLIDRLPVDNLATALHQAELAVDETRKALNDLSYSMWPSVVTQMGLLPALTLMFDQIKSTSPLVIHFQHKSLDMVTDSEMVIGLYRIIQEALSNVVKHAKVESAHVRLWVEAQVLHLQIEDNGVGFLIENVLNDVQKTGLISMRERAFLLKGELAILSALSEGTRIFATFPLSSPSRDWPNSEIGPQQSDIPETDFPDLPAETVFDAFSTLSEREKQIFYGVVNGESSQQMAVKFFISPRTVETHRQNMMHKLGIKGIPALIRFALDNKLI